MPETDGSDPLLEKILADLAPVVRATVARSLAEARARAERTKAATRVGDDEVDEVTRAKARRLLGRHG